MKSTDIRRASGLAEQARRLEIQLRSLVNYRPGDQDADITMCWLVPMEDQVEFLMPYVKKSLVETINQLEELGVEYKRESV